MSAFNKMEREPYPAWARSAEAVCNYHGVDSSVGLKADKVESKRELYGYNELTKPPGKPMWRLVLEQFDDMMVKVYMLVLLSLSSCTSTAVVRVCG